MHGLEARCQETTGSSASGASIGDRKPHLPGLLGEYNTPLPGKPIQFTRISSEGTSKVSAKESDTESIASTPAAILESTDGGQLSTVVSSKDDDEDTEFFDALEHSGAVATSSTVTTAAESVEQIKVKDTDSLGSSSVTSIAMTMSPKVQSSGATKDKEDHLPGPERIDRQLSVSVCLYPWQRLCVF